MIYGFWEASSVNGTNLTMQGWAYSAEGESLAFALSDGVNEVVPSEVSRFSREDVLAKYADAPLHSGFLLRFSVDQLDVLDIKNAFLILSSSDSDKKRVSSIGSDSVWAALKFSDHQEFSKLIQNPAFRHKDPSVQMFGAIVARRRFPNDEILRVSSLVVVLYRLIFGNMSENNVLALCKTDLIDEYKSFKVSSPLAYRWKISLGTAIGYYYLLNREYDQAVSIFADVCSQYEGLKLWPAMATNIFSAHFIAAILFVAQRGDVNGAVSLLEPVPEYLKRSLGSAPLDNFYQYEEHINAIRVAAQCSTLKAIFSKDDKWVGPRDLNIKSLSSIPPKVSELLKEFLDRMADLLK